TGSRPDLLEEAGDRAGLVEQVGVNDLEGHDAVHDAVPRLVDATHPAGAEQAQDLVARVPREVRGHGGAVDRRRAVARGRAFARVERLRIRLRLRLPRAGAAVGRAVG